MLPCNQSPRSVGLAGSFGRSAVDRLLRCVLSLLSSPRPLLPRSAVLHLPDSSPPPSYFATVSPSVPRCPPMGLAPLSAPPFASLVPRASLPGRMGLTSLRSLPPPALVLWPLWRLVLQVCFRTSAAASLLSLSSPALPPCLLWRLPRRTSLVGACFLVGWPSCLAGVSCPLGTTRRRG